MIEVATHRYKDRTVVVAATGPSLPFCVDKWEGYTTIAVNDAWRLIPGADILYACDYRWWKLHKGVPGFTGEKWSAAEKRFYKDSIQREYGLKLIEGKHGSRFSSDPRFIYYGRNSGFQAINLAILFGAKKIILIGFDMRVVKVEDDNQSKLTHHFFGDHKPPLNNTSNYKIFIDAFRAAKDSVPKGVEILNATPGSALDCFPFVKDAEYA